MITKEVSYLLGLITGRGHIFIDEKRIIIEFAHKNKKVYGIAYCPKCGDMATEQKDNNEEKNLICKSCNTIVDKSVKNEYEQHNSTILSIKQVIIPFIDRVVNGKYEIIGNDHMTFLVIDFEENIELFNKILKDFNNKTGFDSFDIPSEIYHENREIKIEFINGIMDTASFPSAGGWLNRDGENGHGRMRSYFQIVRNWKMPVQLCNFLKKELGLPIHTIDWGHPNIRDSNMNDYFDSNPLSWSREHQIKFFPEYYNEFKMRLNHKQEMFKELISHNIKVKFSNLDDCDPPSPVGLEKIKPFHFEELNTKIPKQIRKHYDAYWQICNDMGCIFCQEKLEKSNNKDIYFLTGKDEMLSFEDLKNKYDEKRNKLKNSINEIKKQKKEKTENIKIKKIRGDPEKQLYEPISNWLKKYLIKNGYKDVIVQETASFHLDRFISRNEIFSDFDFCENYKIKPDIVGFLLDINKLVFVEVKINELTLKDIGQLIGYCLVAKPKESILISPRPPSINLIKILKSNPYLLEYGDGKRIKLANWDGEKGKLLEF